MAPSSGHLLVPKAMRILRYAFSQAKSLVRTEVSIGTKEASRSPHHLGRSVQTRTYVRAAHDLSSRILPSRGPGSTFINKASSGSGSKPLRSTLPSSRTSRAISSRGLAPFASTLRPNLTGGALPRAAGGYSLGGIGRGGARQFSHTSGCQAQVLHNVSTGVRAFFINGGKARYDGVDVKTGEKRWKAVGQAEDLAYKCIANAPTATTTAQWTKEIQQLGTSVDFHVSPTITAFLPQSSSTGKHHNDLTSASLSLHDPTVLQTLSKDFARALSDLSTIHHDLNLLSRFGDLPITLQHGNASGPVLRVRFDGCDGEVVSRLCDEVGVRRGIIHEDEGWREDRNREVEMALLFPFAPTSVSEFGGEKMAMKFYEEGEEEEALALGFAAPSSRIYTPSDLSSPISPTSVYGTPSDPEVSPAISSVVHLNPLADGLTSDEHENSDYEEDEDAMTLSATSTSTNHRDHDTGHGMDSQGQDYEGVEGIYRFLRECDRAEAEGGFSGRRRQHHHQ